MSGQSGLARLWRTLLFTLTGFAVILALLTISLGELRAVGIPVGLSDVGAFTTVVLLIANGLLLAPVLGAMESDGTMIERLATIPRRYGELFAKGGGTALAVAATLLAIAALYFGLVEMATLVLWLFA